ncbi:MAG: hypothetical protein V3S21_01425 [Xanthomonadales bacterium]
MSRHANTREFTDLLTAADPARLFIIGGMFLVIAGMIFGDLYAIFILHPNISNIGREMGAAVAAAAAGDPAAVFSHFGAVGNFLENAGTKKDAHVHIIHAGYLAFVLAFLQPWVALGKGHKILLAKAFLWAAVVLPVAIFLIHYVGLVYSPLQSIGWASIFADLSGLVLIIVLAVELVGMWRYMRGNGDRVRSVFLLGGRNSRALLAGGIALVLVGFLFGAYYACIHLEEHECRDLIILADLMEQAYARESAALDQGLAAYGGLQGERGVMIAAHAHVIELGLLALMMAIVQPYVFLSRTWRRRLVWMMLGGSVVLPIAIYSEIRYGLLAGGVADFAGLMVILALFGMLIGVLRHTGKVDAEEGEES